MNDNIVFKRKFRYTIEGTFPGGVLQPHFVKISARPNTELSLSSDFNKFETTLYEMDASDEFWRVVQSILCQDGQLDPNKMGTLKMTMYDGCGTVLEEYKMLETYLVDLKFDDDFACDVVTFVMSFKYKICECKKVNEFMTYHGAMGVGHLGQPKTQCPNCKHEFFSKFYSVSNIIY